MTADPIEVLEQALNFAEDFGVFGVRPSSKGIAALAALEQVKALRDAAVKWASEDLQGTTGVVITDADCDLMAALIPFHPEEGREQ